MTEVAERVPKLRFPEFSGEWSKYAVADVLRREGNAVEVQPDEQYRQIGVRSHGRGLFHKDAVTGADLGGKRVYHVVPNAFVVNIVFAWEQAVTLTTDAEEGFIASHRFPMFLEKDGMSYLPFIREMFLRKRGKQLLELASPGGAGRNKTLGQQEFLKLKVTLPGREEQKKIAAFLGVVDAKIAALRARQAGLERYKRGLMQALFSQRLRFTKPDGSAFPDWKKRKLAYYLTEPKARNRDLEFSKNDVLSVSGDVGCVNQIEHMGRSYAGVSVKDYHVVRTGDVVYTKSPLKLNPYGIIKANFGRDGIVSTLYAVYRPTAEADPQFIHYYFDLDDNLNRYLRPIVRKGAKNDMKVNNSDVIGDPILFPSLAEQQKIADALQAFDVKIAAVGEQVDKMEAFKKGLLQQMFV